MEKQRVVRCWTVLLLAGLSAAALAQDIDSYFVVGGKLNLRPSVSESINNLLWKHDGNLVAEWVKDKLDKVYGNFKGRTNMDKTTGWLEITNMTEAEAGVFTVEINKRDQGLRYIAKAIKEVPKPSVVVRPLICTADSNNCTLSCHGDSTGTEPVVYSWKMGDGEWKQSKKDMLIFKTETSHVKTFTCQMKNPVSEEESEPIDNPLFEEIKPVPPNNVVGIIVGVIVALLVVVFAVVGFLKRKVLKGWWDSRFGSAGGSGEGNPTAVAFDNQSGGTREGNSAAGNGAKPPPETPAGNPETEPLNSAHPDKDENVSDKQ